MTQESKELEKDDVLKKAAEAGKLIGESVDEDGGILCTHYSLATGVFGILAVLGALKVQDPECAAWLEEFCRNNWHAAEQFGVDLLFSRQE